MSIPTHGKFDIIISFDENGGDSLQTQPTAASPQQEGQKPKNPKDGNNKSQALMAAAVQVTYNLGKQAVTTAIGNIGISTGDYYAQKQVQRNMSAMGTVLGLAMAAKNPLMLAMSVGSMAITAASEIKQQNIQRDIANYTAAQQAKRIGYSIDRR